MSPIREKFINAIKALPYDLDKEILERETKNILKEIIQKYIEMYGIDDLSDNDKECIQSLVENI